MHKRKFSLARNIVFCWPIVYFLFKPPMDTLLVLVTRTGSYDRNTWSRAARAPGIFYFRSRLSIVAAGAARWCGW